PNPVVPSPVQRLPSRSNASPFVPGTPPADSVAVGCAAASGWSVSTRSPSAKYRLPAASNVSPDGEHWAVGDGAGRKPTTISAGWARLICHTGQGIPFTPARPVVYRLPALSPVRPSIAS